MGGDEDCLDREAREASIITWRAVRLLPQALRKI
jgi:hypothetical protein